MCECIGCHPKVDLNRTYHFKRSGHEYTGIPLIAANMDTIGTFEMALALNKHNCFTAIHKHYSLEEWMDFATNNPSVLKVSHCVDQLIGCGID